ncbi:Nucleotide-binding universal stress protein, UspA family [Halomicrobium zhouii]|uniref:Nucleotide-binding universal stress protein, UspA family n=1 Tax=Halomicrobium zhouii TaxID=767519 RepID=A0A1I6M819_9EURY|nr:universal stress protein [Halomicrobium zhouii]SFS11846.1 Nucleotide-binding universal stress protein, UspA family [Halomicrobium zhouii]
MYEDILLPFDGSDGAAAALHHAAEIAHWSDATIHVLFVADTTRDSVTVVENQAVDVLVQKGEAVVEDAEKTLHTLGSDSESDVVQGNPAPMIVEYAERYDHDLIVLPTHGRKGVSRYLLGSVTEKVVRLASVPVLTVRMHADEQLTFPYENILVPTDGSDDAARAAEYAISLASALDATVHALSVVKEGPLGVDVRSSKGSQDRERAATDAVEDVVTRAEAVGVRNTVRHIERGSPVRKILDTIDSNEINAVVMGTTGRRGTERILLGSVTEKTVRSAPVPVITVSDGL